MRTIFLLAIVLIAHTHGQAQIITTIAGGRNDGDMGDGGAATAARLVSPIAVALDHKGGYYISDRDANRIRHVDAAGVITTAAGNGTVGVSGDNGPAVNALVDNPQGITTDAKGNVFFVDGSSRLIRKIDTANIITTVAGIYAPLSYNGDSIPAIGAAFQAYAIAIDADGNMYITDPGNFRIRKINTAGIITTIAGTGMEGYTGDNGPAINAEIDQPCGIAIGNDGGVYFADALAHMVRKIDNSGVITTIAGNGTPVSSGDGGLAIAASLYDPLGIAIDLAGNIYISCSYANRIRKITCSSGIISTIAGTGVPGFSGDGGPATEAQLAEPAMMAVNSVGNLYVTDGNNHRIRYIEFSVGVSTLGSEAKCRVYPNPNNGVFTVSFGDNSLHHVYIINAMGQVVYPLHEITGNAQLQLSGSPGMYMLIDKESNTSMQIEIK